MMTWVRPSIIARWGIEADLGTHANTISTLPQNEGREAAPCQIMFEDDDLKIFPCACECFCRSRGVPVREIAGCVGAAEYSHLSSLQHERRSTRMLTGYEATLGTLNLMRNIKAATIRYDGLAGEREWVAQCRG
jgi:hypothetical protein